MKIAHGATGRKPSRRSDTIECIPVPTAEMLKLLAMLTEPLPLSALRPAATAAGLSDDELQAALAAATRRQAVRMVLVDGAACVARSPRAGGGGR